MNRRFSPLRVRLSCPRCKRAFSAIAPTMGEVAPIEPGDFFVCCHCGAISEVAKKARALVLLLRHWSELPDEVATDVLEARAELRAEALS